MNRLTCLYVASHPSGDAADKKAENDVIARKISLTSLLLATSLALCGANFYKTYKQESALVKQLVMICTKCLSEPAIINVTMVIDDLRDSRWEAADIRLVEQALTSLKGAHA